MSSGVEEEERPLWRLWNPDFRAYCEILLCEKNRKKGPAFFDLLSSYNILGATFPSIDYHHISMMT